MKIEDMKMLASLKTKPKILIGMCMPMVMLVVLGAVSVFATMSIVDTNKWVDHTHKVLGRAAAIVSAAVDMETRSNGSAPAAAPTRDCSRR